jgi:hypothetical protein
VPYVVAGAVAAGLLLAEQLRRKRLWFWVPATAWWFLRALVEALYAVVLTAVAGHLPDDLISLNGVVLGVIAGIAGPRAFGRGRIPVRGFNVNLIGAAYQRLTGPLDDEIDESSAEVERLYVNEVIRPAAREGKLVPSDIAEAFREHLNGRHLMEEPEMLKRLAYIDKILNDEVDDDKKVAALVFRAYQIGAYRALQDKLKDLPRRRYGAKRTTSKILRALRPRKG